MDKQTIYNIIAGTVLLIHSSIASSAIVTYSFEGVTDLSFPGNGPSSVLVTASFTLDSDIDGVLTGCYPPPDACVSYGYYGTSFLWNISIEGFTEVIATPNTSEIEVRDIAFSSDRFEAGTDIDPLIITGSDWYITGIQFRSTDFDSLMFDTTALPTSLNDFIGTDLTEFGLLISESPDSTIRHILTTPVSSFQITTVPLPSTIWLFCAGFMGLVSYSRIKIFGVSLDSNIK